MEKERNNNDITTFDRLIALKEEERKKLEDEVLIKKSEVIGLESDHEKLLSAIQKNEDKYYFEKKINFPDLERKYREINALIKKEEGYKKTIYLHRDMEIQSASLAI